MECVCTEKIKERERGREKQKVHTLAGARGTTERVPLNAEICLTRDKSFSCKLAMRSPAANIGRVRYDE